MEVLKVATGKCLNSINKLISVYGCILITIKTRNHIKYINIRRVALLCHCKPKHMLMKKILGLLMFFVLIMPAICRGQANIRKTADSPDHVYSGSALRQAHPTNLWEALKLLEPSLCERDAGQYGSDPNHVPTGVELQGSNRWQAASSSTPSLSLTMHGWMPGKYMTWT